MTTYYFAVGFDAADPTEDQVHQDAMYGFASSTNGGAVTPIGSTGSGGRQFESVNMAAGTGGQPNQFAIALFSSILQIDQAQSFFRCSFRPAHDVQPSSGLALAPVSNADANTLVRGVALGSKQVENANVDGTTFGLPAGTYDTQWLFSGYQISGGQPSGSTGRFELAIEIAIVAGGVWSYYKVDPEMVIDF